MLFIFIRSDRKGNKRENLMIYFIVEKLHTGPIREREREKMHRPAAAIAAEKGAYDKIHAQTL